MGIASIVGLDHAVIAVRDLDASQRTWAGLGFTVSPRGIHSAHLGTANHTIMFPEDYIELIGVLVATDHNQGTRAFIDRGEGLERTAFTTSDAAAGFAALKARGLAPPPLVDFGRPVDLPDGGKSEARFRVLRWPPELAPAGMRLFACQHLTPETVFIPALLAHANGAVRIVRLEIVCDAPDGPARQLSELIDQPIRHIEDGCLAVPSGGTRADFHYLQPRVFAARYGDKARVGSPGQGEAALTIATRDLDAAARVLGARAIVGRSDIIVPASEANGVILHFVQA